MALVSPSKEQSGLLTKEVAPAEEVGSAEEVVETFMETLVDPLLPSTPQVDITEPCQEDQISVARQMHAVVLLFNYYHRKQRSEHNFLDFPAFCKLALSLRHQLVPYMKLMNESELMDWEAAEERLSVTEKAIRDACDIAMALDTSKDVPSTEGYPVSKIAVLLIEPEKENCWLQFGSVTKGVWSLIEKEVDEFIPQEVLAEEKLGKKRKNCSQGATADDNKYTKLMYDAVKDATGIGSSGLVVLETHVTYTLSKVKSATLLYVVRSPQPFNIRNSIPLRQLVDNLHHPFTKKQNNIRTTTASLNNFHMLPYLGFISFWLSRKDLCLPNLNESNRQNPMISVKEEVTEVKICVSPCSSDLPDNHGSDVEVRNVEKVVYENCGKRLNMGGSPDVHKGESKHGLVSMEFIKSCELGYSTKKDESSISPQISGNNSGNSEKASKDVSVSEKIAAYENYEKRLKMGSSHDVRKGASKHGSVSMEYIKSCELIHSTKKDESRMSPQFSGSGNSEKFFQLTGPSEKTNKYGIEISKQVLTEETEKSPELANPAENNRMCITCQISGNNVYDSRNVLQGPSENITNLSEAADPAAKDLLPDDPSGVPSKMNISCTAEACVRLNSELRDFDCPGKGTIHAHESPEDGVNFKVVIWDGLKSRDALAVVNMKRQDLCSKMYSMEDRLAMYEYHMKRMRDGGDEMLSRQYLECIFLGNHPLRDRNESQIDGKEPKGSSSTIFIPGKSSCQDLEYVCVKNNWEMPRYSVRSPDGQFVSTVSVGCKDFSTVCKGGLECSPSEARESAASEMIAQLMKTFT